MASLEELLEPWPVYLMDSPSSGVGRVVGGTCDRHGGTASTSRRDRDYALAFMLRIHGGADATL